MSTLSAGNLTDLRTKQQHADVYLSVSKPATLLTAQINATPTRGQRSIAYDTGSGAGFSTVAQGQRIVFDTQYGLQDALLKSISGTASSGTLELYENGLVLSNNDPFVIYHDHSTIYPVPPAIRSGIFYKFFDQTYGTQNSQPNPVAIIGSHRAGFLDSGSCVFQLNSSSSYAIAQGASIASRVWSCVHNGGGTSGISFSSTTTANPTLTITEADQYWLKYVGTDTNGQTITSYRCIFVHNRTGGSFLPYTDFTIQSMSGDWDAGGWQVGIDVSSNQTLADFPDKTLCVLWHENFFSGVEGYVNLWGVSDEIITCGYLRQDTNRDNWGPADQGGGTGVASFQISTPNEVLDNRAPLGSVSLNAVSSPDTWWKYASWMTTGRSIHHLLYWHAFGVFQACDVFGLTSNTLGVKATDYTEPTLLQQVNSFAQNRGIFAKLASDRLGRLHLVADSQMLNTASRAVLDTVCTITDADIGGTIDVVRAPEKTLTFTDLNGFAFDGATSTPYISIIPGYRESNISYIIPENTGGSPAQVSNQVLASQTDANEKIGRYHALQNVNPREVRFQTPASYLGAFDIIPSIGWYSWGVDDADLKREIELFGRKMLCRHIDAQFIYSEMGFSGIQTSVVLQPEAIGPDGIQGNYPTGYPTPAMPEPDWDSAEANSPNRVIATRTDVDDTIAELAIGKVNAFEFGAAVTYETGVSSDFFGSPCGLSATKGIVCYGLGSNVKARTVNISNLTVSSLGSVQTLFTGLGTGLVTQTVPLSNSKALLFYNGKVAVLSISGDTITAGTPLTPSENVIFGTRLSSTSVLAIIAPNGGGVVRAVVLSISGTTVSEAGSYANASSNTAFFCSVASLSDSAVVITYSAQSGGDFLVRASVLYNITTSFTLGNDIALTGTLRTLDNSSPAISGIDSSRALVAYTDQSVSPSTVRAIAIEHTGSGSLSAGSSILVGSGTNNRFGANVAGVTAFRAIINFNSVDNTASFYEQRARGVGLSGTSLTLNNETVLDSDIGVTSGPVSSIGLLATI